MYARHLGTYNRCITFTYGHDSRILNFNPIFEIDKHHTIIYCMSLDSHRRSYRFLNVLYLSTYLPTYVLLLLFYASTRPLKLIISYNNTYVLYRYNIISIGTVLPVKS